MRGVYTSIEPADWPQGPWRIRGSAAAESMGAKREWAAIGVLVRHWMHGRSYAGNPFSKKNTYYDDDYEIPSQEVPGH
jgi:hypothetical protein